MAEKEDVEENIVPVHVKSADCLFLGKKRLGDMSTAELIHA